MGNRVSMVSLQQLSSIIQLSPSDDITLGTNLFEGGMLEVLKDVASMQLDSLRYPIEHSKDTVEITDEGIKIYEALENLLTTPEQKDLLSDLDEARTYQTSLENIDHFMSGFIHGYAYLKQVTKLKK